jgi:hypothetical protein
VGVHGFLRNHEEGNPREDGEEGVNDESSDEVSFEKDLMSHIV